MDGVAVGRKMKTKQALAAHREALEDLLRTMSESTSARRRIHQKLAPMIGWTPASETQKGKLNLIDQIRQVLLSRLNTTSKS